MRLGGERTRPACRRGRPGHDEFTKFLAPYGRFSSYRTATGDKVPFGFQPALEDSNEQRIMAIGSVAKGAQRSIPVGSPSG